MFLFSRVPLAWLNLAHDKVRFVMRVLGVAFAVFLMFAELGFYNALLDAPVELIEEFNGELMIVSAAAYALNISEQFSTLRLVQRAWLRASAMPTRFFWNTPRRGGREPIRLKRNVAAVPASSSASSPSIPINLSSPIAM